MNIPPGFNSITAYFFVDGADDFIEFLVNGLGGAEVLRHMDGDRVANAQVAINGSTVMVSEATSAFPAMPSRTVSTLPTLTKQWIRLLPLVPRRSWTFRLCRTKIVKAV